MKKINYYLIISILIIIWIDYIPYKLPAVFENAEKFEFVIYNLSLAYIASYIFYYINIYLPEKQSAKIVKRVINNHILYIITTRKKLNEIKSTIENENSKVKVNDKWLTIGEFLKQNHKNTNRELDSILTIQERLPTALLHYTLLLKNHPYFRSTFKDVKQFQIYVEHYDSLSTKLFAEFKKL